MIQGTTPEELGVALSGDAYKQILMLGNRHRQEQVRLFYWRPSEGKLRYSAIIDPAIPIPLTEELIESGNVAFTDGYLMRILSGVPKGAGIGMVHNHFSPNWQGLSRDDDTTESQHLAPVATAATGLPLLGITLGSDGFLSARLWIMDKGTIKRREVDTVRVIGERFMVFPYPNKAPKMGGNRDRRIATTTVWGEAKQALLESYRVGIVGLGSVGSMIAESLARMGVRDFVLIDRDRIESRNLDRTIGSTHMDAKLKRRKTSIAARGIRRAATGSKPTIRQIARWVQEDAALEALLDCDFVFSCVDRHLPRYVLDHLAFSHLIPVINGGIAIEVPTVSKPSLDVSWQAHLVTPGRACMGCLEAYRYSLLGLERAGMVDDPKYIAGASEVAAAYKSSENVFCFSMSCAAHETMQFLAYSLDAPSICQTEPKMYMGETGNVFRAPARPCGDCGPDCLVKAYEAKALSLNQLLK